MWSSVQASSDLQPQLGRWNTSAGLTGSDHDPHLKKGKVPKTAQSYHSVSLTSCMVKIIEGNNKWAVEFVSGNRGSPCARTGKILTVHRKKGQATYMSQDIEAFQEQKLVQVSWIDPSKVFSKVWMERLLIKLLINGIASTQKIMFKRIELFLCNRRARVSVDNVHSKKILLRHGVPQGGVLPPTLFLLFIND